jgi:hypothetical protein
LQTRRRIFRRHVGEQWLKIAFLLPVRKHGDAHADCE